MDISILIGKFFENSISGLLKKIANDFGDEVENIISNKLLEYQVEEYNRNLLSKTILHRIEPKRLDEFYQPLFLTRIKGNRIIRRRRKENNNRRYSCDRIPTNIIKDLFSKNQYITITGGAGSGKSTIIKYLFVNSIDTEYKIPIKVELRYLNDFEGSLIDFIKDKILKFQKIANSNSVIERLLISGKLIIFLDGYDEISLRKKEKITKDIDNLVKLYSQNNYILTSRPYTNIDLLPLFHNYEVCDLSDNDINEFIKKQIPLDERELTDKIIQAIHSKENEAYKSFLSNPLLLSMFILTFQSYSNIPQKRSEFYSQVFDTLFSVHDSMSKLAYVREKQSGLSKEQFIDVLKLFSFISYFADKYNFDEQYLYSVLKTIKEKKKKILFDSEKLISDLQIAIGILNKDGTEYTFPHRSLQEYFGALYITDLEKNNKKIIYGKIVKKLIENERNNFISRDNFFLLLSELDRRNVINLAILPFLKNYQKKLQSYDFKDWNKNIEIFIKVKSIFDAFPSIISNEKYIKIDRDLNNKFSEYREQIKIELNVTSEEDEINKMDEIANKARKLIGIDDIPKILKNLKIDIEEQINLLNEYLKNEDESDSEIINMI